MAAPVAVQAGYHSISARVICGVAGVVATSAARSVYYSCNFRVWSRHGQEYSLWLWGGRSLVLGAMQLVKVCDKVMTYITLFRSDRGYYPHFVDLHVPWILSAFRGYYPHFVDIVDIYAFRGYYLYWSYYKLISS